MSSTEKWAVEFIPEARKDLQKLEVSSKKLVAKAIDKVSTNPLSQIEGGYGKPLGNKAGNDLTGLYKVKLKQIGIRIIYMLVREQDTMRIIIIGMRSDNEVYDEAAKRMNKLK